MKLEDKEKLLPITSTLRVGDILMDSPTESMDELIDKLKGMLKDENIQKYLNTYDKKKCLTPSGVG